jgi:hypothetical protein
MINHKCPHERFFSPLSAIPVLLIFLWRYSPTRARAPLLLSFLDHTHLEFSGRVISSSQRPLPTKHTTNTRSMPTAGLFFSLSLSLSLYFTVLCPGFCLLSVLYNTHTQHNTNIHAPGGIFSILFYCVCTSSVLVPYLDYPAFCLLSLLTTHNTNIHAPGEIRTRNSSKRSAADPRLRPRGHRYRPS